VAEVFSEIDLYCPLTTETITASKPTEVLNQSFIDVSKFPLRLEVSYWSSFPEWS
jgi:hypothetical protein